MWLRVLTQLASLLRSEACVARQRLCRAWPLRITRVCRRRRIGKTRRPVLESRKGWRNLSWYSRKRRYEWVSVTIQSCATKRRQSDESPHTQRQADIKCESIQGRPPRARESKIRVWRGYGRVCSTEKTNRHQKAEEGKVSRRVTIREQWCDRKTKGGVSWSDM